MGSNEKGELGVGNTEIQMSSSPLLVEDISNLHCAKV